MTLTGILEIEKDRKEEKNWDIIHLFKTGGFWSAYEWSAWLILAPYAKQNSNQ